MLRAVKLAGFVALNMVKKKEPSPPIVSLVIFIVGWGTAPANAGLVIPATKTRARAPAKSLVKVIRKSTKYFLKAVMKHLV